MVTVLQEKSANAQKRLERGEMSPVEQEKVQKELQEEQGKIMKFEQEMQQTILKKQQELLDPVLKRVNDAINNVAKEGGYTMIFNASPSVGVILYADETQDVTAAVKSKLGL